MSSGTLTVEVPDIGDFEDVPIIEILVSAGDTVAPEDPLVTLESDKATMDVPSPTAGVIKEIVVSLGDRVSQGSPLMTLEGESDGGVDAQGAAPETQQAVETATQAEAPPPESAPAPSESPPAGTSEAPPQEPRGNAGPVYASPSARRLARELGVELGRVSGSGRKGRITKDDVQAAARAPAAAPSSPAPGLDLPPWPKIDFEKFGPVERVERSRIQRISAPNLARNWVMIPHVTHNDEADITELEAWRKQLNSEQDRAKVTMVSFLVLASVAALKEFPTFNSSLDGEQLVLKRYYNIGFAADTPGGLVVPVIKDADRKGLLEVAGELAALSAKARDGKLSPADMSGSTFTISSLGGIGGTSFTPIVNAPEVAILGVTRSAMKPVWDGSAFVPRLMVPLSLSYDHRVIDGAAAARFVAYLVKRAVRPAPGAAVSASEIRVPDIGDFTDVPVIEIHVAPGDEIAVEDPLVTLESDKATMDVPAPAAGTVTQLRVSIGDRVSEGSVLMTMEADGAAPSQDGAGSSAEETVAVASEPPPAPNADGERDFQVVVLGSGPGGYTAAFRAADLGLRVALVERYERLGGVCLNVGCIPSKALLHAARVIAEAEEMAAHGISFGEPSVDLEALIAWKASVVERLTGGVSGLARQRQVEVIHGSARFAGPTSLVVGDREVSFENCIIAAGSQAARLPMLPDDPRVIDSTGALSPGELPGRLLVIGGGIIGLEMACVYDALGSRVTVVELLEQLMTGADPDLVKPLQKRISRPL